MTPSCFRCSYYDVSNDQPVLFVIFRHGVVSKGESIFTVTGEADSRPSTDYDNFHFGRTNIANNKHGNVSFCLFTYVLHIHCSVGGNTGAKYISLHVLLYFSQTWSTMF